MEIMIQGLQAVVHTLSANIRPTVNLFPGAQQRTQQNNAVPVPVTLSRPPGMFPLQAPKPLHPSTAQPLPEKPNVSVNNPCPTTSRESQGSQDLRRRDHAWSKRVQETERYDTSSAGSGGDDEDGFETYESRGRKKQRVHSERQLAAQTFAATAAAAPAGGDHSGKNPTSSSSSATRPGAGGRKRNVRAPLMIGRKSTAAGNNNNNDGEPSIAAARTYKAVYCVDNVSNQYGEKALASFVTRLGVRVLTCHEVQPRRTRWQRANDVAPDHRAFRICINRADTDRFLNDEKWPADITISRWFSKKLHADNNQPGDTVTAMESDNIPDWARVGGSAAAAAAAAGAHSAADQAELEADWLRIQKEISAAAAVAAEKFKATAASAAAAATEDGHASPDNETVIEVDLDDTVVKCRPDASTPNRNINDGGC